MKIKLYIITYKNDEILNKNLESLALSDFLKFDHSINIINNHSDFNIDLKKWGSIFKEFNVLHNHVRPDVSTGHLARDWNCAIIDGFKNLKNPDCDIVVACQNDTVFLKNWASYIVKLHSQYDFLQFGGGDNYMSWTPNGVSKIGLWDERFCGLGHQEGDYFLRAKLYHGKKVSINDSRISKINEGWPKNVGHYREHNPLKNKVVDINFTHHESNIPLQSASRKKKILLTSARMFEEKWGTRSSGKWHETEYPKRPLIPGYIFYPWFECNIDKNSLDAQNYIYEGFFPKIKERKKREKRERKNAKRNADILTAKGYAENKK
tara:strand:+ start:1723 stop:2685 length:963 start_codon:yes stop_codon:yes gene_type:complete